MQFSPPYLIYLGDAKDSLAAKTGQGIVDWRPEWALGQLRLPGCHADLGIPDLDVVQAAGQGAKTLVIGTVSPGGVLPDSWSEVIVSAIEQGMDVASGLHTRLSSIPAISEAASRKGVRLFDVRHSDRTFTTGTGELRSGKRLLTVGTDCSVGKKYAALCIERELRARDVDADFRATGQTGIFISGRGVSIDAVVADFISGAAEWLAPAAEPEHWDVVEGQGSLFHPSFAGVSLGLLHGTQPAAFVVCHEPTRRTMRNVATAIPSVEAVIEATINGGRLTSPMIRCVGVAINTQLLDEAQAQKEIEATAFRLNLPVTDPMRFGVHNIVDYLLSVC
ncbi:MAG: N-acetyltransferase DgcN [Pseudomonadales bacterium]